MKNISTQDLIRMLSARTTSRKLQTLCATYLDSRTSTNLRNISDLLEERSDLIRQSNAFQTDELCREISLRANPLKLRKHYQEVSKR